MIPHPATLAWASYRSFQRINPAVSHAVRLRDCMKRGWAEHRSLQRSEAWRAAQDAMTASERRISAIEAEIDRLKYAPFGVDAERRRTELNGELYALRAQINSNQRTAA